MKQRWFSGIDWELVKSKSISAPWIPEVKGRIDTSYF